MTDTFRALCAEIIDAHDADEGMSVSRWTANLSAVINRARAALAQPELPPSYIDAEHTGRDQELLEAFYKACLSEGGTADEIHLRGLKSVVARWGRPTPQPVAVRETWPEFSDCDQQEGRVWSNVGGFR